MRQNQKYIRKEWARLKDHMEKLPQSWFFILGLLLVIIAFGMTISTWFQQYFGLN